MTKVAILPVTTENGDISYSAVSGNMRTEGKTAGEALDALTAQMTDNEGNTLIIVQIRKPDRFFSAEQQQRLNKLMARWRAARDEGNSLPTQEQTELEMLIEQELLASKDRATALVDELKE